VPALESWTPLNTTEAPCLIYNGSLGAEPSAGSRGREVESFLALECPTKAAKFAVLTVSG